MTTCQTTDAQATYEKIAELAEKEILGRSNPGLPFEETVALSVIKFFRSSDRPQMPCRIKDATAKMLFDMDPVDRRQYEGPISQGIKVARRALIDASLVVERNQT